MTEAKERIVYLTDMTVGDVFDRAFFVYKRQFFNLIGLYSVALFPFIFLNGLAVLNPELMLLSSFASGFSTLVGYLAEAVLVVLIAQVVLDRKIDRREAIGTVLSWRFFAIFGTILMWGILLTAGLLFCIIPGVYLYVIFAFLIQVMAIEGTYGIGSFRRSWNLAQGSWWMIFGILIAVFALIITLSSSITAILLKAFGVGINDVFFSDEPDLAFSNVYQMSTQIATILLNPLEVCIITMLYFNLRVKKEGFDLVQQARRMGLLSS